MGGRPSLITAATPTRACCEDWPSPVFVTRRPNKFDCKTPEQNQTARSICSCCEDDVGQ